MAGDLRLIYSDIPLGSAAFYSSYAFGEDTTIQNSIAGERYSKSGQSSAINGTVEIEYDTGKNVTKTADCFALAHADWLASANIVGINLRGSNYPMLSPSNASGLTLWLRANQEVDYSTSDNTLTAWRAWNNSSYSFAQGTAANKPKKTWPESRSNWITYSEDLTNAAWTKNGVTITTNSTANPVDSSVTADTVTEDGTTAVHNVTGAATQNIAVGLQYRFSVYAKLGSGTRNLAITTGTPFGASFAVYDLSGGTVVTSTGVDSTSITSLGGGWYRCTLTDTATANGTTSPIFSLYSGTTASYTGNSTSSIIMYGTQLHEAALATTYIGTTSAAIYSGINGNAVVKFHDTDSVTISATTLYGTDFTFACAVRLWAGNDAGTNYTIFANEVLNASGIMIRIEGTPGPNFKVTVRTNQAGANTNLQSSQIIQQGVVHVISVVKSGGTATIYVDGNNVGSGALSNPVTPTAAVSISDSTQPFKGEIAELAVYNVALGSTDRQNLEGYLTAKWKTAPVYSTTYFSGSLVGPNANDLVTTFSTSSAYRYWWLDFPVNFGSGTSKGIHSKAFFGSIFDFAGALADYTIEKVSEDAPFVASSGDLRPARSSIPHYKIKCVWETVTDDKVRDFSNNIVPQIWQSGVFLNTTSYHDVLDAKQLIYARIVDYTVEQNHVYPDLNTVTVTFEEMLG